MSEITGLIAEAMAEMRRKKINTTVLAMAREEIERLQAIIDRLPKTAEGVPVAGEMDLFVKYGDLIMAWPGAQLVPDASPNPHNLGTIFGGKGKGFSRVGLEQVFSSESAAKTGAVLASERT